jgi:hypothetical protein
VHFCTGPCKDVGRRTQAVEGLKEARRVVHGEQFLAEAREGEFGEVDARDFGPSQFCEFLRHATITFESDKT